MNDNAGNLKYIRDTAGLVTTLTWYARTTATSSTVGGAKGYLSDVAVRQGQFGTSVPQSHETYFSRTAGDSTIYVPAASTVYANTNGTGALTTSYAYSFRTFVNYFLRLPTQVVQTGRRLVVRLLAYNHWQPIFFRLATQLCRPLRC